MLQPHEAEHGGQVRLRRHDIDVIPGPEALLSVGNNHLLAAKDEGDQ